MGFEHRSATLDNGIRIHAELDPSASTAAVGIFVSTGARDEPAELMGVSHFLEHMLFKGSATRDAESVNRAFDEIGAHHNAFTSLEMTAYYASCLPEHILRATRLVADLFRPALRAADVEEERGVILEEIAMYDDDPTSVLYEAMIEAAYPRQSLGHRVLGLPQTVRGLTPGHLRDYFTGRYAASNTVVAAAGRIDMDSLVRAVEEETESWPRVAPLRLATSANMASGRLPLTSDKANRGYLYSCWPSPSQLDEDRYAIALACYILGGSEHARLEWALVQPGIAESVSCGASPMDGTGLAIVGAVCDPERLPEVESIIRSESERLGDTLTEDEVVQAKAKVRTGAVFAGERPAGRMQSLGRLVTATNIYTSLEAEVARYNALTIQEIQAALQRWPLTPRFVATMTPSAPSAASA